jgi:chorismate mutase/prephenate dehydratase
MLRKASIPSLRRRIDRIDDQLLRLLNRRARVVLDIAAQKARTNSGVYAPAREKSVLSRLVGKNGGPLPARLVRAVFREIISASRSLEQRLTIAYLGPEATFCHLAARQQFGARPLAIARPRRLPRCFTRWRASGRTSASCRSRTRPRGRSRTRSTC